MLHREFTLCVHSAGAAVMMFGYWFPPHGRCLTRVSDRGRHKVPHGVMVAL